MKDWGFILVYRAWGFFHFCFSFFSLLGLWISQGDARRVVTGSSVGFVWSEVYRRNFVVTDSKMERVQQKMERRLKRAPLRGPLHFSFLSPRDRLARGEIWRNFLRLLNPLLHFLRQKQIFTHIKVMRQLTDLVLGDLNSSPHCVTTLLEDNGNFWNLPGPQLLYRQRTGFHENVHGDSL